MQIESRKKKLCLEPLRGIITQGEKMADTVIFRLPATYGALVLSDLSWQIRAASEKNTLVTADLTASSGGEFCLVQWEVSADFTAVSGALSLMLVGTDSEGNVVIKFPGDDPIWIRDSETGEYAPPPDALEQAVIGIQQAQAALESAQESLEDAAQALQNTTANFRILNHYDSLPELQSAITNPSVGDAYGVGDPTVVYVWNGSAWTQLPGVLVSPSLPMSVANGGTGGTTVTQALANLGAQASNNLLVNPRFKYNSRGQSTYTGAVWTVDGWRSNASTTNISTSNDGILVSVENQPINTQWVLDQQLKNYNEIAGKTLTVSLAVKVQSGSVNIRFYDGVTASISNNADSSDMTIITATGTVSSNATQLTVIILNQTQDCEFVPVAAKLELGSVSTLQAELDNPPPEDVEKLKLDMYGLDPGRCAYLPWHNENLLDNWYFVGGGSQQGGGRFPINQRGQTSYTGVVYGIDRWRLDPTDGGISCTLNPESIRLKQTAAGNRMQSINELIESSEILENKTYTFSILCSGEGSSQLLFFANNQSLFGTQFVNTAKPTLHTLTFTTPQITSDIVGLYIYADISGNLGYTDIISAKLELGYLSTLARKDEEGNWVLNDPPPNFQQELAKCQRYQVELVSTADPEFGSIGVCMGDPGGGISNFAIAICPLPVPMRINPTVTTSGLFTLKKSPNVLNVSSIVADRLSENAISLNVTVQGTVSIGEIYQLWYNPGSGKCSLLLDANL